MISIHALREEGDPKVTMSDSLTSLFLSTPSARRATMAQFLQFFQIRISIHALREEGDNRPDKSGRFHRISIHALREEGDLLAIHIHCVITISIHALREEGDAVGAGRDVGAANFYPRPPRGGRLHAYDHAPTTFEFLSTPSARRATQSLRQLEKMQTNFYPRPPRGGRQQKQRQNLYFLINYTTFCTNLEEP